MSSCNLNCRRLPGVPLFRANGRSASLAKATLANEIFEKSFLTNNSPLEKRSFQREIRGVLHKSKSYETIKKILPHRDVQCLSIAEKIELIKIVDQAMERIKPEANEKLVSIILCLMEGFKNTSTKAKIIKLVYSCKNELILTGFNEKIEKMEGATATLRSLEEFVPNFKIFEDFQTVFDWMITNKVPLQNLRNPNFTSILSHAHAFAFLGKEEFKFILSYLSMTTSAELTSPDFLFISQDLKKLTMQQRQKICKFYRLYQKYISINESHLQMLIELVHQLEDNELQFIDEIILKYVDKNKKDIVQIVKWVRTWPINADIKSYLGLLSNLQISLNSTTVQIISVILSNSKDNNEVVGFLDSLREWQSLAGQDFLTHLQRLNKQNILLTIKEMPIRLAKFRIPHTRTLLSQVGLKRLFSPLFRDFLEDLGNNFPEIQINSASEAESLIQEFEKKIKSEQGISISKFLYNCEDPKLRTRLLQLAQDFSPEDPKSLEAFIKNTSAIDLEKQNQIFKSLDFFSHSEKTFENFITLFDRATQSEKVLEHYTYRNGYSPLIGNIDKFSHLDRQEFDFLIIASDLSNNHDNRIMAEMLTEISGLSLGQRQRIRDSYVIYEKYGKYASKNNIELKLLKDAITWVTQLQTTPQENANLSHFFLNFGRKSFLHVSDFATITCFIQKCPLQSIKKFLKSVGLELNGSLARISSAIFNLSNEKEHDNLLQNIKKLHNNNISFWEGNALPPNEESLISVLRNFPDVDRFTSRTTKNQISEGVLLIPPVFHIEYKSYCDNLHCNAEFDSTGFLLKDFLNQKRINVIELKALLLNQLGAGDQPIDPYQASVATVLHSIWFDLGILWNEEDEDPLYQRVGEISFFATNYQNDPKNPFNVYTLFEKSLNQIDLEPLIKNQQVAGYYCRFNTKTFQNLSGAFSCKFSDLPLIDRNLKQYFSKLDSRLAQLSSVAKKDTLRAINNFINQANSTEGKGNYSFCKEILQNQFLADLLRDHQPNEQVSTTSVKLYTILHYFQSVSDEIDPKRKDSDFLSANAEENENLCKVLSKRDELLINFCRDLDTCISGKNSVISTWYNIVPQNYHTKKNLFNYSAPVERQEKIEKDSKQQMEEKLYKVADCDKKKELFLREMNSVIQIVLEKKIRDKRLLDKWAGTDGNARTQPSHQITYLKNLIAHLIGLTHEFTFDTYTRLITNQLFEKNLKEVIQIFYEHFHPQDIVDALIESIREDAENVHKLKVIANRDPQNQEAQKVYKHANKAYETRTQIMQQIFSTRCYETFLIKEMKLPMKIAKALSNDDRFNDVTFLRTYMEDARKAPDIAKALMKSVREEAENVHKLKVVANNQNPQNQEAQKAYEKANKAYETRIMQQPFSIRQYEIFLTQKMRLSMKAAKAISNDNRFNDINFLRTYMENAQKAREAVAKEKEAERVEKSNQSTEKDEEIAKRARTEAIQDLFELVGSEDIELIRKFFAEPNYSRQINFFCKTICAHWISTEKDGEIIKSAKTEAIQDLLELVGPGGLELIRKFFAPPRIDHSCQIDSFLNTIDQSALWVTQEDENYVDQIVGMRASGAVKLLEIAGYLSIAKYNI